MSNLSFKEKRNIQKQIASKLSELKKDSLPFKEKRKLQKDITEGLRKLGTESKLAANKPLPVEQPTISAADAAANPNVIGESLFAKLLNGDYNNLSIPDFLVKLDDAYANEPDLDKAKLAAVQYVEFNKTNLEGVSNQAENDNEATAKQEPILSSEPSSLAANPASQNASEQQEEFITVEMQELYAQISDSKGIREADKHFTDIIGSLETGAERSSAWNKIREVAYKNSEERRVALAKKERELAAAKQTIGKSAKELLGNQSLTPRERDFVDSIKNKRTLSAKQGKWFDDICTKYNVKLAEYGSKKSASGYPVDPSSCDHADLGSLGYKHGTIVTCPYCGDRAEVW